MKKLINICGTARSGSTLFDLILGNDDKGFSLGEVHAFFRPFRTHHFQINCSCNANNCPWNQLVKVDEKEFYENAFRTLDVDFLVDSSKNIPWVIDNNLIAQKSGIKVFNIVLYKDPISFFYSFWKRGVSIEKAREDEFKTYYNRFFETNLPFFSLNYDRFVSNPENTLRTLCNLIHIPYFKNKEKFWEKQHHHIFGSMGTRKQTEKKESIIKAVEGYPPDYQKIIPKIKKVCSQDTVFKNIVERLNKSEMNFNWANDSFGKIRKPYWYYYLRGKEKIRRYLPEKWEYSQ